MNKKTFKETWKTARLRARFTPEANEWAWDDELVSQWKEKLRSLLQDEQTRPEEIGGSPMTGEVNVRVAGLADAEWISPQREAFSTHRVFNYIERWRAHNRQALVAIAGDHLSRGKVSLEHFQDVVRKTEEEIAEAKLRTPDEPSKNRPKPGCLSEEAAKARAIGVHFCSS